MSTQERRALIAEAELSGARALLSFLRQRALNPDNAVAEITVEAIDDLMTSDDALRHILAIGSKKNAPGPGGPP